MNKVIARVIIILGIITAIGAVTLLVAKSYVDSIDYNERLNERTKESSENTREELEAKIADYSYAAPEEKEVEIDVFDDSDELEYGKDGGDDGEGEIAGADSGSGAGRKAPESTDEGVKYFYYERLEGFEKDVYDEVYNAIVERKNVKVSTISKDTLDKAFRAVIYDHPEIFYVERYMYTTYTRGSSIVSMEFEAKYTYSKEESERMMKDIDKEADRMLMNVSRLAGDYDKIDYVFKVISDETEYSVSAKDNQNMASVFLDHSSACAGYSKATQYLLNKLDIECAVITGEAAGGGHAWNMVRADGQWYYMDVTWGDVDYQENLDGSIDKSVMGRNYDYFMVTSNDLEKTHRADALVALPKCTATDDNYYIHEGLYFTSVDEEQLRNAFQRGYDSDEGIVSLKCSDDNVYGEMSSYLLDQQKVFEYVLKGGKISYSDNPELRTLRFWI